MTLPALGVSYQQGELAGRLDGEDLRIERLRLLRRARSRSSRPWRRAPEAADRSRRSSSTATAQGLPASPIRPPSGASASGQDRSSPAASTAPSVTGATESRAHRRIRRCDGGGGKGRAGRADRRRPAEAGSRDFGPSVLAKDAKRQPGLMSRRAHGHRSSGMPRRVWIRKTKSPEANIELSGHMRLKQQPGGDMQFMGKVEPVPGRGSLDLSGRTFRLTGGEINLDGPVDSTRLDVTAEYQVPTQGGGEDDGVLITVAAKGRLDSLGLEFSSDPTMSQEDVLSYIVTGHPASDNPLESGGGQGRLGQADGLRPALAGASRARQAGARLRRLPDQAGGHQLASTSPPDGISRIASSSISSCRSAAAPRVPPSRARISAPASSWSIRRGAGCAPIFAAEACRRAFSFRGRHAY